MRALLFVSMNAFGLSLERLWFYFYERLQPFAREGFIFYFYERLRPFAREGFIFISMNAFGLSLERALFFISEVRLRDAKPF
jgi:hypothetical protein